jgi:hypothetical protein
MSNLSGALMGAETNDHWELLVEAISASRFPKVWGWKRETYCLVGYVVEQTWAADSSFRVVGSRERYESPVRCPYRPT